MTLIVPYFAQAQTAAIVIDGVTYRVPLIDSAGHLQVDVVSSTLPATAATSAKQDTMITALQLIDDLRGALAAVAADRLNVNTFATGASEVKAIIKTTVTDSSVRATIITPTSDKKVRIVSVQALHNGVTPTGFFVYFGTGASAFTNADSAIFDARLGPTEVAFQDVVWPDGGGPVGAVNEVVSIRTGADIADAGHFVIHYREE